MFRPGSPWLRTAVQPPVPRRGGGERLRAALADAPIKQAPPSRGQRQGVVGGSPAIARFSDSRARCQGKASRCWLPVPGA